jgi:hypothetical protein
MVISTRTPEGDPIRCGVCGREHLVPCGVMLWLPTPTLSTEPIPLALVASKGEVHTTNFANEVTGTAKEIMRVSDTNFGKRLLIRVPLIMKHEPTICGILGIAHRTEIPLDARDGILRLTRSMAAVTTGCRAFA